jgi:hypothetical protein
MYTVYVMVWYGKQDGTKNCNGVSIHTVEKHPTSRVLAEMGQCLLTSEY